MQINKSVLDNGLRIITARLPHLRTVSIAVAVGGGARYETLENAGISHLLDHLILSDQDAVDAIEGLGGEINSYPCEEDILFVCRIPSRCLDQGTRLFFKMLLKPSFPEERFEREKRAMIEERRDIIGSPGDFLMFFFTEKLWEGHPLEADSLNAELKTLPALTLLELKRFYRRLFVSGNMVIVAVGNVNHQEFVKEIEVLSADVSTGEPPLYPRGKVKSEFRVEGMPIAGEQVLLAYGCETVALSHPKRHALDVVSSYLGRGMSSQLFVKLRVEAGLIYKVSAFHEVFLDTGFFAVATACAPENAERVVDIVFSELQALREGRVEEEKLVAAKERLAGELEACLENSMTLATSFAEQELLKGEVITPDQLADKIRAVSFEDILWVSNVVLDPMKFLLVAIGPIKDSKAI